MENLIAHYITDGYYIKCDSKSEIEIAKNAVVNVLGWSRSSGSDTEYPYVGKDGRRVLGYRRPMGSNVISFSELQTYLIADDENIDMTELL